MAGKHGSRAVMAEHESAGERRVVYLRNDADGMVTIGEEASGRLAEALFGDTTHRSELHVRRGLVEPPLCELLGAGSLEEALATLFASGVVCLADLMDELDARGIGYWHSSLGDVSGVTLRRSAGAV